VILPMNANKIFILAAVCLSLAACGGVDPNSPLGKRQAIFKEMLRTSEDLGGMLRGRVNFDEQRFATGATRLDELSRQPWQHFPQAPEGDADSAARDEVWQRQERFKELVRELEASTGQLASAAQAGPFTAQGIAPLVQKVEDNCEACHKEFRAY
jgi:cytochrome c556